MAILSRSAAMGKPEADIGWVLTSVDDAKAIQA